MEAYIGVKIIKAEVMDLDTFNSKFNRVISNPEHLSKEGYHVKYPDGYDSWSPKSVFDEAYRKITYKEFNFIA